MILGLLNGALMEIWAAERLILPLYAEGSPPKRAWAFNPSR
jgi:hypothetical protein